MVFLRWNTVCAAAHTVNVILAPITYGAMLAYLLTPVYNAIRKATERLLKRMIKDQKERNKYTRTLATVGSPLLSWNCGHWIDFYDHSSAVGQHFRNHQFHSGFCPDGFPVDRRETFANNPEVESTVMGIYNPGHGETDLLDPVHGRSDPEY